VWNTNLINTVVVHVGRGERMGVEQKGRQYGGGEGTEGERTT